MLSKNFFLHWPPNCVNLALAVTSERGIAFCEIALKRKLLSMGLSFEQMSGRQVISWSECQVIDTGDEVTVQRMDGARPGKRIGNRFRT